MEEEKISVVEALNIAIGKQNEGKLREAEAIYRGILIKVPNQPDALHLLGLIAYQLGKQDEAVKYIGKAIELKPDAAIFHGNLGMANDALGREVESAKNFVRALELDPKYENAHLANYNLGVYYDVLNQSARAVEYFSRAIELKPEFHDARWNRGLALLKLGKFKEGWEDHESRFLKDKPSDSRDFGKSKWNGSPLHGKRILIASEQGFGDSIQFIRYLKFVKAKGGEIILECKPELKILFEGFSGIDEIVIKHGDEIPKVNYDCYIHLMSLPHALGLEEIPRDGAYLEAKKNIGELKGEDSGKFKVGIVWAGNPGQENDKNRSCKLEHFLDLKKVPGVQLYSLQKGKSEDLKDIGVINLSGKIKDFADTAAIVKDLDLIISVDTSLAHLAGALGGKIWTLLSARADWRWFLDREDSPWYPSMRLLRQEKLGDWGSLFEDVCEELGKLVSKNTS